MGVELLKKHNKHSRAFRIGVMGSASGTIPRKSFSLAFRVGQEIARQGCIFINGATTGLPWESAKGAKEQGGVTIGISPARDEYEHVEHYQKPIEYYDFIFYTNLGYAGRNHLNIFNSDGLIFISGGIGTLNEFSLAYDESKVVGILESSGGISGRIRGIDKVFTHKTKARLIYDSDPEKLVQRVCRTLRKVDLSECYINTEHVKELYH